MPVSAILQLISSTGERISSLGYLNSVIYLTAPYFLHKALRLLNTLKYKAPKQSRSTSDLKYVYTSYHLIRRLCFAYRNMRQIHHMFSKKWSNCVEDILLIWEELGSCKLHYSVSKHSCESRWTGTRLWILYFIKWPQIWNVDSRRFTSLLDLYISQHELKIMSYEILLDLKFLHFH